MGWCEFIRRNEVEDNVERGGGCFGSNESDLVKDIME